MAADVPRRRRGRRHRARSRGAATSCARRAASTRRSRASPRSCSTTCCSPGFALVVLHGTVFPLLAEALQDKQLSVGEPYFDRDGRADRARAAVPHGRRARAAVARRERRGAAQPAARSRRGSAAITLVVARRRSARDGVADVLAFALGAFALASIGRTVVRRRARRAGARTAERVPVARGRARCAANPRLYGGLVVHVGVVVIAVALAASSGYTTQARGAARAGASRRRCAGYTVTYLGSDDRREPRRRRRSRPTCALERGGDDLGVYAPAISTYPEHHRAASARRRCTPVVLHDVYLTLVSSPTADGRGHARRADQPDDRCGCGSAAAIMALGTSLALVPARRRRVPRRPPRPRADEPSRASRAELGRGRDVMQHRVRWIALAVGAVVVVLGVVLALQRRHAIRSVDASRAVTARASRRPRSTSTTLDGSRVTLGRPRGQDRTS